AWWRLVGRWNLGGVANVLHLGGRCLEFFGMAESLEAALWLDAGNVIVDTDWLPWGLGFNKWGGASPVGRAGED
ncbi:hypothetical protein TNCV_990401, partial [Trichonephila clavipes]